MGPGSDGEVHPDRQSWPSSFDAVSGRPSTRELWDRETPAVRIGGARTSNHSGTGSRNVDDDLSDGSVRQHASLCFGYLGQRVGRRNLDVESPVRE